MKVYIAAPYTNGDTVRNVRRVIDFADSLVNCGLVPFVPHLTHFWHFVHPHGVEFWYKYDLEWLQNCDVLIRLSGESKGADTEVEVAKALGIPVVYSFDGDPDITRKIKEVK